MRAALRLASPAVLVPLAGLLGSLLLAPLAGPTLRAQERGASYAVTAVPAAMLRGNPDAVVRLDEFRFDVEGPGRATTRVKRAVTVLRASGREHADAVLFYDRFRRVESLGARLYDHAGALVRRSERGDVGDLSAVSGGSLFDDARVKTLSLTAPVPYTVEVEYEIRHEGLFGWPEWYPYDGRPVETARFVLSTPAGYPVRLRPQGDLPAPTVVAERGRQVQTWEMRGLATPPLEPYGPDVRRQMPSLFLATDRFSIGGTDGRMTSWADVGAFYARMARGRQTLPEAARADVAALVAAVPGDDAAAVRERVARLYRYAQQRTRYVSVQLGIGGWQPYDAAYVHARSYGDCKALTNYVEALLDAAGIASFPVLVGAGDGAPVLDPAFPDNAFNHVILAVPTPADTVWLETTSQTAPFGHLGTFTEGRWGLLIKDDTGGDGASGGSHLVRIPRSPAEANRQIRHARITGLGTPETVAEIDLRTTGNQADRVRDRLLPATPQEREAWLVAASNVPVSRVVASSFDGIASGRDTAVVTARLRLARYGTNAGSRLLVPLLLERWTNVPAAPTGTRSQPIEYAPYDFEDTDSVEVALPAGMRVEALPSPVSIEAPFGAYRFAATATDGRIVVSRHLRLSADPLPPEQYDALRTFLGRVVAADASQAVLAR